MSETDPAGLLARHAVTARPKGGTLPRVDLAKVALFLDFDGTLVDLAERPDGIVIPDGLEGTLAALESATLGGLVLISGRGAADLAGWLPGYTGPIVGGHGAEERVAGEISQTVPIRPGQIDRLDAAARDFAASAEGLIVERKATGIVVHYRQAPDRAGEVAAFVDRLVAENPPMTRHDSKMAVELRPAGIGKDISVARLMETRLAGRMSVMFGDDTTDEPALAWVDRAGGLAVKVGEGESAAPHRLGTPAEVRQTLRNWLKE